MRLAILYVFYCDVSGLCALLLLLSNNYYNYNYNHLTASFPGQPG